MAISKKQEHELMKRYLSNMNVLKGFLKTQDLVWVNGIYTKLGELIAELTQEYEIEQLEAQEREKKRLELIAMIEAEGWSLGELMNKVTPKKNASQAKKEDKYCFPDENGKERRWSGLGMKPKALQALLDKGHQLEEFLIEKAPNKEQDGIA